MKRNCLIATEYLRLKLSSAFQTLTRVGGAATHY